ncbi:GGDEF domain-containing protein [Aliikangiella coralliicola]|uniref:diguanylate cyclase n=1 Tax=Aliikangiella coralliicola TaxID=2592383 RepID=A0A545UI29_9GAMM|nr:GGDEF domain-containing protein [Aliikangiella coralliicola]TQV89127.1 diguanylate cyclase [Aliikangiella coralliicola]
MIISRFLCATALFLMTFQVVWAYEPLEHYKKLLESVEKPEQAIELLNNASDSMSTWEQLEQGEYFVILGSRLEALSRIDDAYQSYSKAIEILTPLPVSEFLIEAHSSRSYIQYLKTFDTSVYCPEREVALEYARKLQDDEILAKALTSLAFCYQTKKNFSKGIFLLEEAIEIAQKKSLSANRHAMIYNATAILYRVNWLLEPAYEYNRKAYNLWASVDDRQDMFNMLHSMTVLAISMGKEELAEKHVEELFELADTSPEFKDFHFFANYDAGSVALLSKKFERAIHYFERALALANTTNEKIFTIRAHAFLAEAFFRNKEMERAYQSARKYLQSNPNEKSEKQLILKTQAIVLAERNNSAEELEKLFLLLEMEKESKRNASSKLIASRSVEHDDRIIKFEKQLLEKQLAINQLELERQKDRQRISRLTIATIGLVVIVLSTIIIFLFRSRMLFKQRSQTDVLTGIANRSYIFEKGKKLISHAVNNQKDFSVILFDIDKFKSINDTHGHYIGDEAIIATANQAKHWLRNKDMVGRIGGEEYLILLPGTGHEEAFEIAERLRQGIAEKNFEFGMVNINYTISLGVASLSDKNNKLPRLVKLADEALYRAKSDGRNCTKVAN